VVVDGNGCSAKHGFQIALFGARATQTPTDQNCAISAGLRALLKWRADYRM
jgi:hypothetical protein